MDYFNLLLSQDVKEHIFSFCKPYQHLLSKVCKAWAFVTHTPFHYYNEEDYAKLSKECVKTGNFKLIVYLYNRFHFIFERAEYNSYAVAIKNDREDIVRWMITTEKIKLGTLPSFWDNELAMVAGKGNLNLLCYMLSCNPENDYADESFILEEAILSGNLELVQYLHMIGFRSIKACDKAAAYGHLHILRFFYSLRSTEKDERFTPSISAHQEAALYGYLHISQWLHEIKIPWDETVSTAAAEGGHLKSVQWLIDNGCPYDDGIVDSAAQGGHFGMLKWALMRGYPSSFDACFHVGIRGDLDMLIYLREHGCPWNANMCAHAAKCGHFDILKYAISNGCPWDGNVCELTVDKPDIFKWAILNGCPIWKSTCRNIALDHNWDLIQWLANCGRNVPWRSRVIQNALLSKRLDIVEWAINLKCTWKRSHVIDAVRSGSLKVLKWVVAYGCPWNEDACAEAAKDMNLKIMEWIINQDLAWVSKPEITKLLGTVLKIKVSIAKDSDRLTNGRCTKRRKMK